MDPREVEERLRERLRHAPEALVCASPFGSFARDEVRPASDIDVAVRFAAAIRARPRRRSLVRRRNCSSIAPEAFPALVPGSDFKSDGERGDAFPAGSIPVRFRQGARFGGESGVLRGSDSGRVQGGSLFSEA